MEKLPKTAFLARLIFVVFRVKTFITGYADEAKKNGIRKKREEQKMIGEFM
jgi:hypothetical protein